MALPVNLATVSTPATTRNTSQINFDLTDFGFWSAVLYGAFISTKIKPINWPVLSNQSFITLLSPLVALKVNSELIGTDADTSTFSQYIAGKKIPVFIQNIINCVPVVPRFNTIPVNIMGIDLIIDATGVLRAWANTTLAGVQYVSYNNELTNWTNPQLFSGALTTFSMSSKPTETLFFSQARTLGTSATTVQIINYRESATVGGTTLGVTQPFNTKPNDSTIGFSYLKDVNMTPQWLFTSLALGTNFQAFVTQMVGIGKTVYTFTATDFTNSLVYLSIFQSFQSFPNPAETQYNQTEGKGDTSSSSSTSEAPPSQDRDTSPKRSDGRNERRSITQQSRFRLRAVKIRKSRERKVSAVLVTVTNLPKSLSTEEREKVNTLLSNIMVQAEKAANVMQLDSSQLFNQLSVAWKNAEDRVVPDYGDQA